MEKKKMMMMMTMRHAYVKKKYGPVSAVGLLLTKYQTITLCLE
jgi:hypothetical protein